MFSLYKFKMEWGFASADLYGMHGEVFGGKKSRWKYKEKWPIGVGRLME